MLCAEININKHNDIGEIRMVNRGPIDTDVISDNRLYQIELYSNRRGYKEGEVTHHRNDGAMELIRKTLNELDGKEWLNEPTDLFPDHEEDENEKEQTNGYPRRV